MKKQRRKKIEELEKLVEKRVAMLSWRIKRTIESISTTKGKDLYVVVYTKEKQWELREHLREWAENPELSFSWGEFGCIVAGMKELEKQRREIIKLTNSANRFAHSQPPPTSGWQDNLQ